MGKEVSMQRVAQAILLRDGEFLQCSGVEVPYHFARFRTTMMVEDLLIDIRSIKARWDVLKAKGIIRPMGEEYGKALMNVREFGYVYHYTIQEDRTADISAQARTHTAEESA